ncbi:MAG TPA: winged helix-turn-helix transcriptional regulator [Candidatus Alistipes excrementavium]|nr:winged helix-turn-helix transcriptional regulator [Candidatus Alistipes excrementavium]
MENRKIFIRAECAPSGTYRADRAPDGRSRSCRRSGPDGAMRFSEFRRSVEAISHRMFAAALRMSEANATVAAPPAWSTPSRRTARDRCRVFAT